MNSIGQVLKDELLVRFDGIDENILLYLPIYNFSIALVTHMFMDI